MAVKRESRREHNPVKSSRRRAREHAEKLAPLEETKGAAQKTQAQGGEGLALDTGELKLPEGFLDESGATTRRVFRLEPVVIFILLCALVYIAFIIYLISIEPAQ